MQLTLQPLGQFANVRGEGLHTTCWKESSIWTTRKPTAKNVGKHKQIGTPLRHTTKQGMEGAGFWPPLYSQRHRAVATFLASHEVSSLLDFGCGEGTQKCNES